jgi:hypothetical protein
MHALENELKAMKTSEAAKRNENKNTSTASEEENEGDAGQGRSSKYANVEDPLYANTKGRLGEKRKKSGLHLKGAKVLKCIVCGTVEHMEASCSAKISPGPEPKQIDFFRNMVKIRIITKFSSFCSLLLMDVVACYFIDVISLELLCAYISFLSLPSSFCSLF